ncbi:hypothetical protein U1Q18_039979 [Sarracenia purpurea var. burkii]
MTMESENSRQIQPTKRFDRIKACKEVYKKRKQCVMKKTMELATLCGIKACTVCFGPNGVAETWPENQKEVRAVIEMYREYRGKDRRRKNDVQESSSDEKIIGAVKKHDLKKVLSGWSDNWLCGLSRECSTNFLRDLDSKLQILTARIEFLKVLNHQQFNEKAEAIDFIKVLNHQQFNEKAEANDFIGVYETPAIAEFEKMHQLHSSAFPRDDGRFFPGLLELMMPDQLEFMMPDQSPRNEAFVEPHLFGDNEYFIYSCDLNSQLGWSLPYYGHVGSDGGGGGNHLVPYYGDIKSGGSESYSNGDNHHVPSYEGIKSGSNDVNDDNSETHGELWKFNESAVSAAGSFSPFSPLDEVLLASVCRK